MLALYYPVHLWRLVSVGIKYANVCAVLVYIGEYSASVLYSPSEYFPIRNISPSH